MKNLVSFATLGILLASGAAHARAPALQMVPMYLVGVALDVGCGPPPPPGSPPPVCPPTAHLSLNFFGSGCAPEDFVIKVVQTSTAQQVSVLKRASSTMCLIQDGMIVSASASVDLSSDQILQGKPIRWMNSAPVIVRPRP